MKNSRGCWPKHEDCLHRNYIGRAVTLYGSPAKIEISSSGFAQIVPTAKKTGWIEISWAAVYNICDNYHGHFNSSSIF